ncbi:MAG: hypothetical protein Q8L34_01835, partial [Candidatus Woesearchaeota archaeon]|nr:hypothetical protein [Candidatus Woesearchaeota archaeon]
MKREMILVLGILMLGISACAQDFATSDSTEQKKDFYQQILPDTAKPVKESYQASPPSIPTTTPPAEVKKQTEAKC